MKNYNIVPQKHTFSFNGQEKISNVLKLGEEGRGRKLSIIPCEFEERPELIAVVETKSGRPKLAEGKTRKGWAARINELGCYTKNTYGSTRFFGGGVTLVSEGIFAYGDAGRIGGASDYLLIIEDETFLLVRPCGGYKMKPIWYYFGTESCFKGPEEEMALFCDTNDLKMPSEEEMTRINSDTPRW